MSSSLFGIYNAHRSLLLNQAAINLISNNISNINTPGYSKQRLELSQSINMDASGNPLTAAQAGLGAIIDNISRNREAYLDSYYRGENTTLNYYKELNENAALIEDITNELNNTGLTDAFSKFYDAAQQLNLNPTDSIMRNIFVQSAIDLSNRFNLVDSRLEQERTNLVGDVTDPTTLQSSKIKLSCDDLNTKLDAIADLNHTIAISTSQGMTPNSILDERDKLIDEIAEYIPINVDQEANNLVSISVGGTYLVKGAEKLGYFNVASSGNALNPATVQIVNDSGLIVANANSMLTTGKIGAILEMGGSDPSKLNIYNINDNLNTLAVEFAREVNTINRGGQYINTSVNPSQLTPVTAVAPPPDPFDIFIESASVNSQANYAALTAGNIRVNQDVIDNPFKIAAASATSAANETGDGSNALLIAQIRNQKLAGLGFSETGSYLNALVGEIGIQTKSIEDSYESQSAIVEQVDNRRESVIGVNLDEELADLVKYQRAFEATARIMNVVSEQLEKIVNLGA